MISHNLVKSKAKMVSLQNPGQPMGAECIPLKIPRCYDTHGTHGNTFNKASYNSLAQVKQDKIVLISYFLIKKICQNFQNCPNCLSQSKIVRFSKFWSLWKAYENSDLSKLWARTCTPCFRSSATLEKDRLDFTSFVII